MRIRALVAVSMLYMLVFAGASAALAAEKYGLGGGGSLSKGSLVSLLPGQSSSDFATGIVQNVGTEPADVEFVVSGAPAGVEITASEAAFKLRPRQVQEVSLSASAGQDVTPGEWRVTAQFRQTNIPKDSGGGVAYAPAVDMNFLLRVGGESGTARVVAVSGDSGSPLSGTYSIHSSSTSGLGPKIASAVGTELTTALAVGRYVAHFEISGLASATKDFEVASGEFVTVELSLKAVSFFQVAAKPDPVDGSVVSATLIATVSNQLRPIPGPVVIEVAVTRDGEEVETVQLEKLDLLQSGLTDTSERYVPPGGWQQGEYVFDFQVTTPEFIVKAGTRPAISVPGFSLTKVLLIGGLIGSAAVGAIILLRRRARRLSPTDSSGTV